MTPHRPWLLPARRKLLQRSTHIDEFEAEETQFPVPPINLSYGGQSLHNHSHGESFFTLLEHRFRGDGLFLLDEPEAALSTQRQLAALALILETVRKYPDAQFIISTHSPILLAAPCAQIFSFDSGRIHPIAYEDTPSFQITRRFLNDPSGFLERLTES